MLALPTSVTSLVSVLLPFLLRLPSLYPAPYQGDSLGCTHIPLQLMFTIDATKLC